MPTRLEAVVIDSPDPPALAQWWVDSLGWRLEVEDDESDVLPPAGEPGLQLVVVPVHDPRQGKNRVHLDLRSADSADQKEIIESLIARGAREVNIGQGSVPWTVLADPEGNEFCVLEPREIYQDTSALAAVVVDSLDPGRLAAFWEHATGWPIVGRTADTASLQAPNGSGPFLEFVRTHEPHRVKNRVHLDVAPYEDDDHGSEVDRLRRLGARPIDVGQSAGRDITWTVLADPEGNEFCVLSPR